MCALVTGVQTFALPFFRVWLFAGRSARAGGLGGAVRRLLQRRADYHRPVHRLGRVEVAAAVGRRHAAAAWLRGAGAGALLRPRRALSAALRRGQYAGGELHHAGQLLPRAEAPVAPRVPQAARRVHAEVARSAEHTSELQSLMRISYAVFCLKKKTE